MSTPGKTVAGIRFGPFVLEAEGRRLMRDGRRVPVTPIELKLLETLLRNRHRVLTGDDLRLLVWADDPLAGVAPAQDVNALYVAIRKLRRSLGDEGKWIVNIPKVGYTFSEDVSVEGGMDGPVGREDARAFFGRAEEMERLKKLLSKSRLITLTGLPGIGKSRLAAELAADVADEFTDGTYWVDLVPIENESLVGGAVLGALGIAERAERTELDSIVEHLDGKQALIVMDNCEHLIDACSGLVDSIIRKLPTVRVVATSLEPLLLSGESVMPVSPLDTGSSGSGSSDAVDLFVSLARQHRSDVDFEKEELRLIGDLCRKLEGLPLAIELAAVQIGAYTVEQIIDAMADRFRLLRRRGGENVRHRTLEDAVEWSFSLLSADERTLILRLSVFTGGWTVESARFMCADDGIDEQEVVHLLAQLVRRSLVQLSSTSGTERYSMLETIRQFARRCLRDSGDEETILDRRDSFLLDLSKRAFDLAPDVVWLERSKAEYDNVRLMLDRSIRREKNIQAGLLMCGALGKFWYNYGLPREAKFWSKLALEADDGKPTVGRARALRTAGYFFGLFTGPGEDPEVGRSYFEQSLAIWRGLDGESEEAYTLVHYSFLLYRLGHLEKAKEAAEKSLEISSAVGDQANIARAGNNLGLAYLEMGESDQARSVFEVALSAARLANDQFLEALCMYYLGELDLRLGEAETADDKLTRGLELFKSIGNRPHGARCLLLQGEAAALLKNYQGALELKKAALREFRDIEDQQGIASALEAIACSRALSGSESGQFLELISAAAEMRRRSKLMLVTRRKDLIERLSKKTKASLGKSAAAAAAERGRTMALAEAIEIALSADR